MFVMLELLYFTALCSPKMLAHARVTAGAEARRVLAVNSRSLWTDQLFKARNVDFTHFISQFIKDKLHFSLRNTVQGSNVGKDSTHAVHIDTVCVLRGIDHGGSHDFLSKSTWKTLSVTVMFTGWRRCVSSNASWDVGKHLEFASEHTWGSTYCVSRYSANSILAFSMAASLTLGVETAADEDSSIRCSAGREVWVMTNRPAEANALENMVQRFRSYPLSQWTRLLELRWLSKL